MLELLNEKNYQKSFLQAHDEGCSCWYQSALKVDIRDINHGENLQAQRRYKDIRAPDLQPVFQTA